ncbi:MAG TPA: NADH-quinone oxidoreductase subunit L [Nitrospirota bacterium]|nr:NADH-quinone oxidoreductase subunit L [Nitrospirota bacterium]
MLKYALIPILPFTGFLIAGLFGKYLKERAAYVAIAGVVGAFLLSLSTFLDVLGGMIINENLYSWISMGTLNVNVGFQIDQLTAVMLLVVTTLSSLIHIYSVGYMHGDKGYARFFSYLALFTFFMLVLVMANNFLLMFVGWEGVGLCSYLLIGFWYEKKSASDAGVKAFVVNRVGDFGFVLAMLLIFITFGTLNFTDVFAALSGPAANQSYSLFGGDIGVITLIALLLFLGATGKSAQLPLYVWLPDAMEGPTPVSALIHAATMVTAGVFMVARCAPIFSLSETAMTVVAVVGGLTAVFAATIGLVQNDIKRVIAYSTISQLGYMFLGLGVGAFSAGIFHLTTHAFFKGLLFLASGSVIHALSGEQDMRKMGALKSKIKITHLVFIIGSLALAGIFPFAGFFSKDEILWSAYSSPGVGRALWILGVVGALMTAFYSFRLIYLTFYGESRVDHAVEHHVHESPKVMTVPLMILAFFSVTIGWIGMPGAIIPHVNLFGDFLAPLFPHVEHAAAESRGIELGLMLFSVLIALAGIRMAYSLYVKNTSLPDRIADRYHGIYTLLLNKYKVDEIYNYLFVDGLVHKVAKALYTIGDVKIIDGFINWFAGAIGSTSQSGKKLQTGYVQQYAFTMGLGLVVLVGLYYVLIK